MNKISNDMLIGTWASLECAMRIIDIKMFALATCADIVPMFYESPWVVSGLIGGDFKVE